MKAQMKRLVWNLAKRVFRRCFLEDVDAVLSAAFERRLIDTCALHEMDAAFKYGHEIIRKRATFAGETRGVFHYGTGPQGLAVLALALSLAAPAFADAPAPSPKPRRPPVAVAVPVDGPGELQPDSGRRLCVDETDCDCWEGSGDTFVACPPPVFATRPARPVPTPPPSSVEKANARGFHVDTQFGALATVTGETGTDISPTFWINADGPIALGERSIGRLGARLGLTSSPGTTFNAVDVKTYNAIEVDLFGGYVIGAFRGVETTVVVEGGFSSRMKGDADPLPRSRLVRSMGAGLRFDARRSSASMTVKGGFDEATASCIGNAICTGVHSGFALMLRGQVPIIKGAALFIGDVSLSVGGSVDWLTRRDILRIGATVDPVELVAVIKGSK